MAGAGHRSGASEHSRLSLSRRDVLRGAAALPVLFTPAIARAQTRRIGAVLPLSGNLSRFGAQARLGLELALEEINEAGGILGQTISIDYRDDAADPAEAEAAARGLTSDPDVVAVAGPVTSASRNALSATMLASNTPLLYATDYEGGDCGRTMFYFNSVPNQSAGPLMRFLLAEAGTDFYLLGADYIWPQAMFRACANVIAEGGGTVAGRRFVPLAGLADYGPVISDISASGASVLVLALPGTERQQFMTAAKAARLLSGMTIGNLGAVALYNNADDDNVPIYGCAPFIETDPSETAQAFVARARIKAGSDMPVSAYAATHYSALKALKAACEKTLEVTREGAIGGFAGLEYQTPTGVSRLDAATRHSTLRMTVARATGDGLRIVQGGEAIAPQAACVTGG